MTTAGRRSLLKALAALATPAVGACRDREAPPVVVPLSGIAAGQRLVVHLGSHPLEARRTSSGVQVRSLLCTHMGCPVRWLEERGEYLCPCHEGRYDRDGRVIEGCRRAHCGAFSSRVREDAVVIQPGPAG